jgi:hypothetical protein
MPPITADYLQDYLVNDELQYKGPILAATWASTVPDFPE